MKPPSSQADRKRVVIVGAAGRLGGELCKQYGEHADVIALSRADFDLANPDSAKKSLEPLEYDRLILCGALTAVDYCESHQEEALDINARVPGVIAEICARKGAHMTYISTDFVFDGSSLNPYAEDDLAEPISVYGLSKREGEKSVLAACEKHLVARVSWLYGSDKPAFPEWIINQAMAQDALALPGEKYGTPTYTKDLGEYLGLLLAFDGGEPAGGIFHLSNSGSCSWQRWGQLCIDVALEKGMPLKTRTISANRLDDVKAFAAKRPVNSVLSLEKFERFTGVVPRRWDDATNEYLLQSKLFNP